MRSIFLPDSLEMLWSALEETPEAMVYAGGTDLLVKLRQKLIDPPSLICLERIKKLKGVRDQGGEVWIGAGSTHADLLLDKIIQREFPVLVKALMTLGSPLIRNMGTIGGNICTASPAGDMLPPLYVLNAEVEIRSKHVYQRLPLKDFILGPGKTCLSIDQIVSGIWIKKSSEFNIHHFEKVGQRKAMSIAIASFTALLRISKSGIIERAHLAWGSVAPTIVTSAHVEECVTGKTLSMGTLQKAIPFVQDAVNPIDDIRASTSYRRAVAENLLLRLLEIKYD